ncbi:unnamed protein product [Lathyrus oleraceus]
MPPREQFPTKGLDGAPSEDIGWYFGTPEPENRNNVRCKLCNVVIKGGITRLKQHIAHMKGQVTTCGRVTTMVRENMMELLLDSKAKGNDSKRRKEEFEERLRGDDEDADEDVNTRIDDQLRYATQESLRSHREWENMQQFRRETRASENAYEHGGSSRVSVSGAERPEEISFSLRYTNIDLVRSQSMKQPRVGKGFLKTWRKRLGEAVSKYIIYERLPMNLSNSPWLHNLIYTASEVGKAKCPTPYEISNVYLESEYK